GHANRIPDAAGPATVRPRLEYLARLWLELRPPGLPNIRVQVAAAVVNLTGAGSTSLDMALPGTKARTCVGVVERNLRDEGATETLVRMAEARVARCILPFIPLMRGGAGADIIEQRKAIA